MRYAIKDRRLWEFADRCRTLMVNYRESGAIITAAFATLLRQGWVPEDTRLSEDLSAYVRHAFPKGSPQEEALPVGAFSDEELAGIVMWRDWNLGKLYGETSTPSVIARIAAGVLGCDQDDRVADVCCGYGSFMSEVVEECGVNDFYGIDLNVGAAMVSKMRAAVLGIDARIEVGDLTAMRGTFNKVFMDAPLRPKLLREDRERLAEATAAVFGKDQPVAGEWYHSAVALSHLAEGGRMVAVMAGHALYSDGDRDARRHLVKSSLVESVVLLPERLHPATSIALNIVVFSRGGEGVRFVDATDLGSRGRRNVELSREDVREIVRRVSGDSDAGVAIAGVSELTTAHWRLDPRRYVSHSEVDGVPLGSIAEVSRGANIPARALDERITDDRTPWRYLMIKDVGDYGEISEELPFLKDVSRGEERFLLQDCDIVIGRMPPFKSALVRVRKGENVLCTGNLFVLRPDVDEVDPTYLRLFLASDVGITQLRDACVGSSVRSIPINGLKEVKVPMAPMNRQRKVAAEYRRLRGEMEMYRRKLDEVSSRMAKLFPEGGDR